MKFGFSRLGREFFWIATGEVIAALGNVGGVRILTSLMPPSTYGELALGMTISGFAQQIGISPLAGALLRYFAAAMEADSIGAFLQAARALFARLLAAIIAVAAIVMIGLAIWGHRAAVVLVTCAVGFTCASALGTAFISLQTAARHRVLVAWHQAVGEWLRYLVAAALVLALGPSGSAAMAGYALAGLAVLASQAYFFRRFLHRRASLRRDEDRTKDDSLLVTRWRERITSYSWPFFVWGGFTWAQLASDRWALELFSTSADVGRYSAVYQLGYAPGVFVSNLLVQLIGPVVFERAGDGESAARNREAEHLVTRFVVLGMVCAIVVALTAALVRHWAFALLVGPAYRGVAGLWPWMVLGGGLFAAGQAASLFSMARGDSRELLVPKIFTAILGVGMNFLGAWYAGVRGVVAAVVIFSTVYLAWCLTINWRRGSLTATRSLDHGAATDVAN